MKKMTIPHYTQHYLYQYMLLSRMCVVLKHRILKGTSINYHASPIKKECKLSEKGYIYFILYMHIQSFLLDIKFCINNIKVFWILDR